MGTAAANKLTQNTAAVFSPWPRLAINIIDSSLCVCFVLGLGLGWLLCVCVCVCVFVLALASVIVCVLLYVFASVVSRLGLGIGCLY